MVIRCCEGLCLPVFLSFSLSLWVEVRGNPAEPARDSAGLRTHGGRPGPSHTCTEAPPLTTHWSDPAPRPRPRRDIGQTLRPSDEPPGPAPRPEKRLLAPGAAATAPHSAGLPQSAVRCAARPRIAGAGPPGVGSGPIMRPPSRPLGPWLYLLAGALVCTLHPSGSQVIGLQREECIHLKSIKMQQKQCLEEAQQENETIGCSKMWDNLTCWPATPQGQVVVMACPLIFSMFTNSNVGLNVSRNCTDEGWTPMEPSSYGLACGLSEREPNLEEEHKTMFYIYVKTGYTIGYSLSLTTLLVATIILSLFRKLHCTRNYIHMHLFISFILRVVAVFIKDYALFVGEDMNYCEGSVGCKVAMVLFQYCVMANFFWLLVEGLYLYTLLAVSFFSERKYFWGYIIIGWGIPSIFIMVWTIARIYLDNFGCWDSTSSSLWWIIKTPILTSILVNFILFICIIRILVQKLRPPDVGKSDRSPYSRLTKSTLLLIPLFGVHYIMFAFFPDNFKTEVRIFIELIMGSFQGFMVAVLYCFLNGEVQSELRRKWRRWRSQGKLGVDPKYHHPSGGSNGATYSTQVSVLTRISPGARRSSSFQAEVSLL